MSLLQHALNVAGLCAGAFSKASIRSGFTVTLVDWNGCMATDRTDVDVGTVVRHAPSPHDNGKYEGVIVKWDRRGEHWEPLAHFRKVDGALEVWR